MKRFALFGLVASVAGFTLDDLGNVPEDRVEVSVHMHDKPGYVVATFENTHDHPVYIDSGIFRFDHAKMNVTIETMVEPYFNVLEEGTSEHAKYTGIMMMFLPNVDANGNLLEQHHQNRQKFEAGEKHNLIVNVRKNYELFVGKKYRVYFDSHIQVIADNHTILYTDHQTNLHDGMHASDTGACCIPGDRPWGDRRAGGDIRESSKVWHWSMHPSVHAKHRQGLVTWGCSAKKYPEKGLPKNAKKQLKNAVAHAWEMVDNDYKILEQCYNVHGQYVNFELLFGSPTRKSVRKESHNYGVNTLDHVNGKFARLHTFLDGLMHNKRSLVLSCGSDVCDMHNNAIAYTMPSVYEIVVCSPFWKLRMDAYWAAQQPAVIIHEATHLHSIGDDHDVRNPNQHHVSAYGLTAVKELAVDLPDGAMDNADTMSYFVTAGVGSHKHNGDKCKQKNQKKRDECILERQCLELSPMLDPRRTPGLY